MPQKTQKSSSDALPRLEKTARTIRRAIGRVRERASALFPQKPERPIRLPSGSHVVAALGWGLLTAAIFHMIWQCNIPMHMFANTLTLEQVKIFRRLCRHRAWITLAALLISFLPAFFVVQGCAASTGHFLFFWLLLTVIIYQIWPKRTSMLQNLDTPQQAAQWYAIYCCMRNVSLLGFILGFVFSLIVAYGTLPSDRRSLCTVLY